MEAVRKEAEGCEALQGFQMIQNLSGGTGGGLGTAIMSRIKE